jgi:hypothetical protein
MRYKTKKPRRSGNQRSFQSIFKLHFNYTRKSPHSNRPKLAKPSYLAVCTDNSALVSVFIKGG